MKVALLFEWEDLQGVYRSRSLAKAAVEKKHPGKALNWKPIGKEAMDTLTAKGVPHYEIHEEEVLEA